MNPRTLLSILISLAVITGLFSCASRSGSTSSPVKGLLAEQNYKFKAEFATPLGGRQILLTGPYELVVTKESITAHLPYFGVAPRAPIGVDEAGIKFTSKDFKYNTREGKNGWTIQIKPNDGQDVRTLNLRVSRSGSASLQVTSNYRQSISYSGQIVQVSEKTW